MARCHPPTEERGHGAPQPDAAFFTACEIAIDGRPGQARSIAMSRAFRTKILDMSVPVFDPNRYPRTYRPWIVLRIVVGLLCALIVAAFANTLLEQVRQGTLVGMSSCLLDLAVIALAAVAAMSLLRARLVMTPTSLELRSLWTTRRVLRRDILDHELLPLRSGTGFRVNASTLARTMVSAMPIGADPDFRAWFAGLPDSGQVETARNLQAIVRDEAFGATPGERADRAARARRTTLLLGRAVLVLAFWTCLYPHPRTPLLVLNAACPWVVLWLCWRSNGLFSLAANKNSGRGELFIVQFLPIAALGWRAFDDVTLAGASTLFLWSSIAGAAMTMLSFVSSRDLHSSSFTTKLLNGSLLILYAWSALALANSEFDTTPGVSQRVSVVARRITHTRSATRYLTVAPTPADMASPKIEVSNDLYHRARVGGHVCLIERDGALGWHWIQVMAESVCPTS